MFRMLIRVLFGFILACLIAALAQVLFVITPDELVTLPAEALTTRTGQVGILALVAATHFAIFAAPFALVVAAFAEWQAIRGWAFYVLAGLAIALAGFLAQYTSEVQGQATIVNNYALRAFLTTGFVGGLVYWLVAGRGAGGPMATADVAETRPAEAKEEEPVPATTPVAPAPRQSAVTWSSPDDEDDDFGAADTRPLRSNESADRGTTSGVPRVVKKS